MPHTDDEKMKAVIESIASAGYEPYDQIYGYFYMGIDSYITRTGNARNLIKEIDREIIAEYLKNIKIDDVFLKLK